MVTYVLPSLIIAIREYLDPKGLSPFASWFGSLDAAAAAKVTTTLARIEQGNSSSVQGVGAGVYESRIDFGHGYRVYFGKEGETIVILLGGGTRKRQSKDILSTQEYWMDYKARKAKET